MEEQYLSPFSAEVTTPAGSWLEVEDVYRSGDTGQAQAQLSVLGTYWAQVFAENKENSL